MRIPDAVSRNSETNPSHPFYIYASPDSDQIVTITNLEFGRAAHRAAHLLRPSQEGPDRQVVAVLALSDTVLYHAVLVGLMTANFIPFAVSPRNSPAGIFQLLRDVSCHRIVATCITLAPLLAGIKKHADEEPGFVLDIEEIPSLAQIYPNLGSETMNSSFNPYSTESPHSLDDIALYMHSSGSTGFPKAIAQTHRALMGWSSLPAVAEMLTYNEKPLANMALPSFHLFGIVCQLLQPLSGSCVAVYPPTATSPSSLPVIPSPDNILDHARKTKCRSLTSVPALLAHWFNSPSAVEYLKTLHAIVWSGGPLPQRVGDGLADAGVHLVSGYGSTEVGAISVIHQDEADHKEWAWWSISDLVKVRWVPQGDDTFECHILTCETHIPMVENLDDVKGYATGDLCVNHPQKKHLWRVVGRLDDMIVHTSGEKTLPAPMENIITGSPLIAGAVIFGSERPQTGILVETPPSLQIDIHNAFELAELRNKIWPIIEEANATAPAFSRIFKEMIIFATPDKPLPRAGKGTVLRKATIALYAPEIESLYNTLEEQISSIDSIAPPIAWEISQIQKWLLELAGNICNSTTLCPTVDLRQQGFDSLTATIFRLHVMRAMRSHPDIACSRAASAIPQNLVYSHPTISQLSIYLQHIVDGTLSDTANGQIPMDQSFASQGSSTEENIVEICSGPGVPLIIFPGATGRLGPLLALRSHFVGTLWGVQVTASTPIAPFTNHIVYLVEKIRQKQPDGPYRLAAFSGSSLVGVAVAKLLEDSGEQVVQLSFIDGFPLLWTDEGNQLSLQPKMIPTLVEKTITSIIDLLRHDPLYGPNSEEVGQWDAALYNSPEATDTLRQTIAATRRLTAPLLQFLADFNVSNGDQSLGNFADRFTRWVLSVKAPFSVLIAELGMITTLAGGSGGVWADLGARRCERAVQKHLISGVGHYGILADKRTAALLQQY